MTFEFIVDGPPVSQQTRRRERYHEWKNLVRAAAERYWPLGIPPLAIQVAVTIFYFFEGAATDVDNVVKPIHDAMVGLVYADDRQVSDSVARRRDLFGEFTIINVTPVLAQGLHEGREFLSSQLRPLQSAESFSRHERHRSNSTRIAEVADKYRASGYEVLLEPTAAELPEFLSGYRPDFIARQKGESVLVDVRVNASATDMDWYCALVELVQSHPGWRLDLVVTNPPNSLPIESDYPVLPIRDINKRYDEAEELLRTGHVDAAVLIAWTATEAALRIIAQSNAVEVQRSATPSLLKELATQGIVSREQYESLWNSYRQRSAVAHGFSAREEVGITKATIESGKALLREIDRAA